jgi:DNA-directed RNA polymerase specialized sigma24 family protein
MPNPDPPAPAHPEDLRRVEKILDGDERAFQDLYESRFDAVTGWIRIRLRDGGVRTATPAPDPDDLVRETFEHVYGLLDRYRGDTPLDQWILGIAREVVRRVAPAQPD